MFYPSLRYEEARIVRTSLTISKQTLAPRIVTRLRALIVLPTRDLVAQVRETIEVLSKGTKLKVCGLRSFVSHTLTLR